MEIVHTPVLLNECLELLSPMGEAYSSDALMIDSTLGEGGHSFNFLTKYPSLNIIGLDADAYMFNVLKYVLRKNKPNEPRRRDVQKIHEYSSIWLENDKRKNPGEYA